MTHSRELAAAVCVVLGARPMMRRGSPTRGFWAKPGFARREPNRALEFKTARRRGLKGEPGFPVLEHGLAPSSPPRFVVSPRDA